MQQTIFTHVGVSLFGQVLISAQKYLAGNSVCASIGTGLKGFARNSVGNVTKSMNDIIMAKQQGFIIADASGYVGYVADRRKQRDREAILIKDSTGIAGGSDEN